MKTIMFFLTLSLFLPLLVGCVYVNDSRLYSVQPSFKQEQSQQIAKVVETLLAHKGLVLKERHQDTYPEDLIISTFEIPRCPDENRRDPLLIFYVRSGTLIQLQHTEWWLTSSKRPKDYIKDIAPEIVSAVKTELGLDIEVRLVKEDIFK